MQIFSFCFLVFSIFGALQGLAADLPKAGSMLSDGKDHWSVDTAKKQLIGHVSAGFHFNKDAPAGLTIQTQTLEPLRKTPQELVFDISSAAFLAKNPKFAVSFYVCDDQNTVCESHELNLQLTAGKLVKIQTEKANASRGSSAKMSNNGQSLDGSGLQKNKHGFYEQNLAAVLETAKKENKLVLVDFRAPWCPSCLRLETEVFGEKIFQQASENLLKVSVNLDQVSGKELSSTYEVKVIPTLILMNSEGKELGRLMDFKPAPLIARDLRTLQSSELSSYEELKKQAEKGDEGARRALGERAFRAVNYEEAVRWLSPLKDSGLMLANSEVNLNQEKYEEDKKGQGAVYQSTLEKWIAVYPQSLEAIQWRTEVMKVLRDNAKQNAVGAPGASTAESLKDLAQKNILFIQSLLSSEEKRRDLFAQTLLGDYSGFERMELLSQLAETQKQLDSATAAKSTLEQLAKELAKLKLSEKRPGQVLVAIGYMKQAGLKKNMESWYQKLAKANPSTDVFYAKLARFYFREKEFSKALPWAKKAAAMKSDLPLQNYKVLVEIYAELRNKSLALEAVNKALAMPDVEYKHNKKIVSELEHIKWTLNKR